MAKSLAKTRSQWAKTINESWGVALKAATIAVKAGFETGTYLLQAKEDLPHGEFEAMCQEDLAIGEFKAQSLMKIASSPQLAKASHGKLLPPAWTVLRKLSELEEEDFKWAVDHDLISPDMTRGSAIAIKKARRTEDKIIHVSKGERGPTPDEARKLARASGRLVAASDGRMYSGATKEEGEAYAGKRSLVYGIKEAIVLIAECEQTPEQWVQLSQDHWIHDFDPTTIDEAIDWLKNLRPLIAKRQIKVVRHA